MIGMGVKSLLGVAVDRISEACETKEEAFGRMSWRVFEWVFEWGSKGG